MFNILFNPVTVAGSSIKVILTGLALVFSLAHQLSAQTIKDIDDGTELKQIIIFGRHSIRASTSTSSALNKYSSDPYPAFSVSPGILTTNGERAALKLGYYFHDYLVHEGLLTGDADTDLAHAYFRANTIQRSYMTCAQFGAGLIPNANIPVYTYPAHADPVIDPLLARVAEVDPEQALTAVQSIYGSGFDLASAYSNELALISQVLYPIRKEEPRTRPILFKE